MKFHFYQLLLFISLSCNNTAEHITVNPSSEKDTTEPRIDKPSLLILGNVQDAGSPQIACKKDCCKNLFLKPNPERNVVCIGILDPENKTNFIIEATPDLPAQMKYLKKYSPFHEKETPDGIFLTHAHIGHYAGLMYLGKEAMNAERVPVYAMPRMKQFLEINGPWSQLVNNNNIAVQPLNDTQAVRLTSNIKITPFLVPHRDEYSETVGYRVEGPSKKALFIPDIDKWEKWKTSIVQAIAEVDYAFIDATFYDGEEISNRNIAEIPHPFVIESMKLFNGLPASEKNKIHFIHFNHTNPLLNPESKQTKNVLDNGYKIARMGQVIPLY